MDKLGIQPLLLLAQIINFGIIVFVLNKLLYKPVLGMIQKRKKEIEDGMALSLKLKEDSEKWEGKQRKMMDQARKDAIELVEKAKKDAKAEKAAIVAEAHTEAAKMIKKRKEELETDFMAKEKDLNAQAVRIALLMLEKTVPGMLSTDAQHDLIERKLKQLDGMRLRA